MEPYTPTQPGFDVNALGQAIDTTFGRSSTPKVATYSVKVKIDGVDRVSVSYAAIVNFGTERAMIEMKRRYADESVSVIDAVLKRVKETYKGLTGRSLKLSEVSSSDSVEITSSSPFNPKRQAYYRRKSVFDVT